MTVVSCLVCCVRAFVVTEIRWRTLTSGVREVEPRRSTASDVLVEVDYSGDQLQGRDGGELPRVACVAWRQLVGGVDAAGTVTRVERSYDSVQVTRVAVHGGDLGVARDGGFATVRLRARALLQRTSRLDLDA